MNLAVRGTLADNGSRLSAEARSARSLAELGGLMMGRIKYFGLVLVVGAFAFVGGTHLSLAGATGNVSSGRPVRVQLSTVPPSTGNRPTTLPDTTPAVYQGISMTFKARYKTMVSVEGFAITVGATCYDSSGDATDGNIILTDNGRPVTTIHSSTGASIGITINVTFPLVWTPTLASGTHTVGVAAECPGHGFGNSPSDSFELIQGGPLRFEVIRVG
jgi:hypothetical protein